jgi:OHCU decarboxylase
MPQTLDYLNTLPQADAIEEFRKCCGSHRWAQRMVINRPYLSLDDLCVKATDLWWDLDTNDWLEAFRSHPKIGEQKAATEVSTEAQKWSGQEQANIQNARIETLNELARLNHEYETKFGFIYIVCASGKSSNELLAILNSRINNEPAHELTVAASEQAKITDLRLRKLIT